MKPFIAVDFDGTLIPSVDDFYEGKTGDAFPGAVEFLRALAGKYTVVIFSARATTERGKKAIQEWIRRYNLRAIIYDVTNEKRYTYMAFIDDRAITFNSPSDYISISEALGCILEKKSEKLLENLDQTLLERVQKL